MMSMALSQIVTTYYFRLIILLVLIIFNGTSSAVAKESQIQEFRGSIEDDRAIIYELPNLKKGDTFYAYMANKTGNLDPMLGLLRVDDSHGLTTKEAVKAIINSDQSLSEVLQAQVKSSTNLIEAFLEFSDEYFITWDDDSGDGYDAMLAYKIPADGVYYLLARSMVTNQFVDEFKPGFTYGSFRLLLGLNAPDVRNGKGEAKGGLFATVNSDFIKPFKYIEQKILDMTQGKLVNLYRLRNLRPNDVFYAKLSGKDDYPLPQLFLKDFGGKPIAFGKTDTEPKSVRLSHHSREGASEVSLLIDGSNIKTSELGVYELFLGINAPEVLQGDAVANGSAVIQESNKVKISMVIDQIVNVDQQKENFTVVGSLQMIWQAPDLAFSPDKCNCSIKQIGVNDLRALAVKNDIKVPVFAFFNQQGNRWSQGQIVFIEPSGRATLRERFTVTLQAPDFDFSAYPFDRQKFNIRVDLIVPTDVYSFQTGKHLDNILGDQLGEEEWSVVKYSREVTELPYGNKLKRSRFTMSLEVKRHMNFYIFRIFLPMFLIISVSWVIFFLKDYGRQLSVASGNLMVFVAFNFTISDDLPRLGYLTLLDRMILTSFAGTAFVVFISVFQKRLEAKGNTLLATRIDNVVLILYPLMYFSLVTFEYFLVTF